MKLERRERVFLALGGAVVLAALLALRAGVAHVDAFRAELGASDDAFLPGNDSAWGRAYRDSGPFRVRPGERRMTYFAARMAFPEAGPDPPLGRGERG